MHCFSEENNFKNNFKICISKYFNGTISQLWKIQKRKTNQILLLKKLSIVCIDDCPHWKYTSKSPPNITKFLSIIFDKC